jgi:hypothetical protein
MYERIKPEILEAIQRWVDSVIEPGGFVMACLENDLSGACGRADSHNQTCLFEIVSYIYNEVPSPAWGSEAECQAWAERFR